MILQKELAILVSILPIAGLVFQAGRQSERIEELFMKTALLESEQKNAKDILYDIHGKVCAIEQDIKYIQKKI